MQAPAAPSPLSPLSMSSNDSSFVGRYGSLGQGGTPNDVPYAGGPYNAARPPQGSPPSSQHPSSSTDMSRPSMGVNSINSNRPPSSSSSVALSSDGRTGLGKSSVGDRDSSRSGIRPEGEEALQRHYFALKTYLAAQLRDEKGNIRPNRARDKLLRLSVTQFMELSTDVYDELIRREDERQRGESVPRFLLPRQNFHPKRNQARQKLSTLPTERFRQLATDVYYELERRIPRFVGGETSRPRSTTSNASSRSRGPSHAGMRPPPSPGYGFPPGPGRGRGQPPPGAFMAPGPRRPSEAGSLGRPLPKHLQSNTIVPNKGTMVEDDEMDDDEDAFALDHVGSRLSGRPSTSTSAGNAEDKERIQAQDSEITELKERIQDIEKQLAEKEDMTTSKEEKDNWNSMREELEQKIMDMEKLNDNMEQELIAYKANAKGEDESRREHERDLANLREQLESQQTENDNLREQLDLHQGDNEDIRAQLASHRAESEGLREQLQAGQDTLPSSDYEQRVRDLEEELAGQEKVVNEVREEAMLYLREMRDLSRQADEAIDQEEKMAAKIAQLEQETDVWRQRYSKVKAQNKSLRASTMGLGLQTGHDTGKLVRQEGLISEGGLVRDTDVTRFQLAVDELLKVARQASTDAMLESVKSVVISVQSITAPVGTDGYPTPSPSPHTSDTDSHAAPSVSKLKARVIGTANSLITATKQHAASHGLSPVALLDAAASNLTASVVELIKAVRIRPSSKSEFRDLEAVDELHSFYDETMSPGLPQDTHSLQIPVPTAAKRSDAPLPPLPHDADSTSPKNANGGWFGWAGKWAGDRPEDQHGHPRDTVSTTNGAGARVQSSQYPDDSDGEYDPYR